MLEELKERVYRANMLLPKYNLVTFTWGNVSAIDRESGLFAIKPSGVEYDRLEPSDIVLMDLEGNKVEGKFNPSSDTKTHLELYRAFKDIGGIVHTHSPHAVAFAQAGRDIDCLGTTHCDYFYGAIPCIRHLTEEEIAEDYEGNTGRLIVKTFEEKELKTEFMSGCICRSHGPFAWGRDELKAVHNAVVMEEVAKMNLYTYMINKEVEAAPDHYIDKHFMRKHGPNAYYGQKEDK